MIYSPAFKPTPELIATAVVVVPIAVCVCAVAVPLLSVMAAVKRVRRCLRGRR